MAYSMYAKHGGKIKLTQSGGDPSNPGTLQSLKDSLASSGIPESEIEVGFEDSAVLENQIVTQDAESINPALLEIQRLESAISSRRYREAIAGADGGWLANQESLIATERGKL